MVWSVEHAIQRIIESSVFAAYVVLSWANTRPQAILTYAFGFLFEGEFIDTSGFKIASEINRGGFSLLLHLGKSTNRAIKQKVTLHAKT